VVKVPQDGPDVERERREVRLVEDRLHELRAYKRERERQLGGPEERARGKSPPRRGRGARTALRKSPFLPGSSAGNRTAFLIMRPMTSSRKKTSSWLSHRTRHGLLPSVRLGMRARSGLASESGRAGRGRAADE